MKRVAMLALAVGGLVLPFALGEEVGVRPATGPARLPATGPTTRRVEIDLDKAVVVALPVAKADLEATAFKTSDGREGWVIKIPGDHPIATPAIANGVLYVGGGYGSHEFYAFNAETGKVEWQIKTGDDGPSAAVVEEGSCAFNTESCTIYVTDAKTGRIVWEEWLGDPLMSQPAIAQGKVYIAYPGGSPRGAVYGEKGNGDQKVEKNVAAQEKGGKGVGPAKGNGHRLLCADLKTGKHLWEQDISGDVLSAPVIDGDRVFLTCFDGTSFCMNGENGEIVWQKKNSGTSAPLLADGQLITTERENSGKDIREGVRRLDAKKGDANDKILLAGGKAEYFRAGRDGPVALSPAQQKAADAGVGFGGVSESAFASAGQAGGQTVAGGVAGGVNEVAAAAQPAAGGVAGGLDQAAAHLNIGSVAGGWAYQGSRAAYSDGRIMNAQANALNCITSASGAMAWRAEAKGKGIGEDAQLFSPPALGKTNMYLCTARGHLMSVTQKEGAVGFVYDMKAPMAFQPAMANGNIYVGTVDGRLICLKTGDKDADGWTAWGGNAQHNKK